MTSKWMYLPLAIALAACGPMDTDDTDDTDTDTDTTEDTETTEDTDTEADPTIVSTVVDTPRFSILEAAVIKAELTGALSGGITVFAPNDTAFDALFTALGVDGVDDLTKLQLTKVLTYHVVAAEVDAAAAIGIAESMDEADRVADALGGKLDLSYDGTTLSIDAADVVNADIEVSDGIIHEIDAVLVPSILDIVTTDDELTVLTSAAVAANADTDITGLLDGTGTFTLFAPTDAAFTDLLTGNSFADLDAVVTALGGAGPLAGLLSYHVLGSAVNSTAAIAADGMSVEASTMQDITVDVVGGNVVLNDGVTGDPDLMETNTSTVVAVDIVASNGIIHKIDKVIVPPPEEMGKGPIEVIRN